MLSETSKITSRSSVVRSVLLAMLMRTSIFSESAFCSCDTGELMQAAYSDVVLFSRIGILHRQSELPAYSLLRTHPSMHVKQPV